MCCERILALLRHKCFATSYNRLKTSIFKRIKFKKRNLQVDTVLRDHFEFVIIGMAMPFVYMTNPTSNLFKRQQRTTRTNPSGYNVATDGYSL